MIFVGDIALEDKDPLDLKRVPEGKLDGNWIGNLEGPVTQNACHYNAVYTTHDSLTKLTKMYKFKGLSLANNHILDLGEEMAAQTVQKVQNAGVVPFGYALANQEKAHRLTCNDAGEKVMILNYGWSVIGCQSATDKRLGCKDVLEDVMVRDVLAAKIKDTLLHVVVYLHWGIELEVAPQPYHRFLAKKLIDAGASAIIGCHAHRFQGAEMYKGKPIVYGLGNWMFARKTFWRGRLDYPAFCDHQIALNINFKTNEVEAHIFKYDTKSAQLSYEDSTSIQEINQKFDLERFEEMSEIKYSNYFAAIREKTKLVPIYQAGDSELMRRLKNNWIAIRHYLITVIKLVSIKRSNDS